MRLISNYEIKRLTKYIQYYSEVYYVYKVLTKTLIDKIPKVMLKNIKYSLDENPLCGTENFRSLTDALSSAEIANI